MSTEDKKQGIDLSSLRISKEKKYDDRPKSKIWKYFAWLGVAIVLVIGYFMLRSQVTPATKVQTAVATLITGSDAGAALVATGYVVAQRKAEVAFGFNLNTGIVISSLVFALVMGFLGGFLPAMRASRFKIINALRAK